MNRYGMGAFLTPPGVGPGGEMIPGGVNPATLSKRLERYPQTVHDRANYAAAGAASITFFSIGIGGSATLIRSGTAASVAKTIRDTYMRQQGLLPNIAWHAYNVYFVLIPATAAPTNASTDDVMQDLQVLIDHAWVEFRTVDKLLYQLALSTLTPFKGTLGGVASVRNDVTLVGAPFVSERFSLVDVTGEPMAFEPNQSLSATMYFDGSPALTQTWDIVWSHDAYIVRPS